MPKESAGKLLNPRLIELEGMAMVGMVKRVRIMDCQGVPGKVGYKKLVAELTEGGLYETGCMEPDAAKRNFMVLTLYARRWAKLINTGEEK